MIHDELTDILKQNAARSEHLEELLKSVIDCVSDTNKANALLMVQNRALKADLSAAELRLKQLCRRGVNNAPERPLWQSAAEPPSDERLVIVRTESGHVFVSRAINGKFITGITHWMEVPQFQES